jgi:hypothetical protein
LITRGRSVHENGRFYGQSDEIDDIGQKIGPFLGREGLNDSSSQKKGRFYGRGSGKQKRDTPERMSNQMQMLQKGASALRHPRQRDFRRKLKQRGRPVRPEGVTGMPLTGAVSVS